MNAAVRTITPPSPLWSFCSSLRWRSRSASGIRREAPTPHRAANENVEVPWGAEV